MANIIRLDYASMPPGLNGPGGLKRMWHGNYTKLRNQWSAMMDEDRRGLPAELLPVKRCSIEVAFRVIQFNDWDNLYSRFKILGDALVAGGILVDDNPKVITDLHCSQSKVRHRNEVGCTIHIRIEDTK